MKLKRPFTKRLHQCGKNSAMMLAILFSLKILEALENELQPHCHSIVFNENTVASVIAELSQH